MHIQQLQIDKFGKLNSTSLQDLSPSLNVVYGPTGSGKATIARFIQSVFYGVPHHQQDAAATRFESSGSVTTVGRHGRCQLKRVVDGSLRGRLEAVSLDGAVSGVPAERAVPECEQSLFSAVFNSQFRENPDTEAALQLGERMGLWKTKVDDSAQQHLEARLHELEGRRAAWTSRYGEAPLETSASRRQRLLDQIRTLESSAGQRESVYHQREELLGRIQRNEETLRGVEAEIASLDADIADLENQHAHVSAELDEPKGSSDIGLSRDLQQRIEQLNEQIDRWQGVQNDVTERCEKLRGELVNWATGGDEWDLSGPPAHIAALEQQMQGLKKELAKFDRDGMAAPGCGCGSLHDQCRISLREMRERLYTLCEELSKQQYKFRRSVMVNELKQLRRCHGEVKQYLSRMTKRRKQLHSQLGQVDPFALDRLMHMYNEQCECDEHADFLHVREQQQGLLHGSDIDSQTSRLDRINSDLDSFTRRRNDRREDAQTASDRLVVDRRQLEELGHTDPADSSLIARKRQELEHEEREHQRLLVEWRDLSHQICIVTEELEASRDQQRAPSILVDASHYLSQMTSGEYVKIRRSVESSRLVAEREDGTSYVLEALSRATKDHAHLAVCMAIVATVERRGVRCPMILNDAFFHVPANNAKPMVEVLKRFADQGRQVIVFTSLQHVAQQGMIHGAIVRNLHVRETEQPSEVLQAEPVERRVAPRRFHWEEVSPTALTTDAPEESTVYDVEGLLDNDTEGTKQSEEDYFLRRTDSIQRIPDLHEDAARSLTSCGIHTVGDFLRLTSADLRRWPQTPLSTGQLRHGQSMASILCDVKNLRPYDVRILVGAGIESADQLRGTPSQELLDRVEAFVKTPAGRTVLESGDDFELARVANWIRSARESQAFQHVSDRAEGNNGSRRSSRVGTTRTNARSSRSGQRRSREGGRRERESRSRQSGRSSSRSSRSSRSRSSKQPERTREHSERGSRERKWKFYLERSSDVEDAPSIGPKMAQHLAKVGVITVGDLLNRTAKSIAAKLDHSRVSENTVALWQQQAAWMCRVPQLRGHDAQILVAVGYESVEQLQDVDAAALFAEVESLVATKEGKRILRGGNRPDLAEIKDWLDWAKHSRQLRVA